ncbi:hypothetical protein DL89DRAFT_267670 [Linderina pennispora]|uniref:G-protein coupled receptors family 3 profile domain-containing protein n=1 Tax=Linderina pennispora TaxID=61395 RepID=A0A1Y1W7C2_9FUNG|nr:uncharacterized protein DL89DRAFT_267670 [Linderina pennispora]ORX69449.1 hypothetical protein DL89DRAFT_267670 [Linderina pennispora]
MDGQEVIIQTYSGWDTAVVVFGAAMLAIDLVVMLYIVWNRKYPPIRAKNIPLLVVLFVSLVIWYIGSIATQLDVGNINSFSGSCILFAIWFRVLLGVFLFTFVNVFRLYTYIRIFRYRKPVKGWSYWIPVIIFLVIILAFGLTTTLLHESLGVFLIEGIDVCRYTIRFKEIAFGIVWFGWLAVILSTFLARNINTSFNEYYEMLAVCIITSIAIAYETIIQHILANYILFIWSRTTSALIEVIAGQVTFFILVTTPVYNCLVNREGYQKAFFEKMHNDGMTARYLSSIESSSSTTRVHAMSI